jgi:hypothetical protein
VDVPNTRLRIATRIHFALLRHLGEGIDVGTMLKNEAEAREVLWVCEGWGDPELVTLARQYVRAGKLGDEAAKPAGGQVPHDTPWAHDTSGFGLSQAPAIGETAAEKTAARTVSPRWFDPTSWLRRGTPNTR